MSPASVIKWNEVLPIAQEAFSIWVGQPELGWAEQAWGYVDRAGLTTATSSIERLRVYIRFLVLASIYRDWCSVVWDESHDDSPHMWLADVDVSVVHVGQLLGPDVELSECSEDDVDDALNILMAREREAVVAAVLEGFGGVSGFFLALSRSNRATCEGSGPTNDADDLDITLEAEADILSDVSVETLAGYQWIDQGCELLGPIRCIGEMDDRT